MPTNGAIALVNEHRKINQKYKIDEHRVSLDWSPVEFESLKWHMTIDWRISRRKKNCYFCICAASQKRINRIRQHGWNHKVFFSWFGFRLHRAFSCAVCGYRCSENVSQNTFWGHFFHNFFFFHSKLLEPRWGESRNIFQYIYNIFSYCTIMAISRWIFVGKMKENSTYHNENECTAGKANRLLFIHIFTRIYSTKYTIEWYRVFQKANINNWMFTFGRLWRSQVNENDREKKRNECAIDVMWFNVPCIDRWNRWKQNDLLLCDWSEQQAYILKLISVTVLKSHCIHHIAFSFHS